MPRLCPRSLPWEPFLSFNLTDSCPTSVQEVAAYQRALQCGYAGRSSAAQDSLLAARGRALSMNSDTVPVIDPP